MPELRLVVSNPFTVRKDSPPIQNPITPFQPPLDTEFRVDIKNRGFNLYEILIQDPSHYLECDLILDSERERMICHFPTICDEQLKDFIEGDEVLHWIIMNQFQMKVLEQLLLFCSHYHVSQLIIYTDDMQASALGVYQGSLINHDRIFATNDEQTQIIIPLTPKTLDTWTKFMREKNLRFAQELWRNQRSNSVIRRYLKSHPFSS